MLNQELDQTMAYAALLFRAGELGKVETMCKAILLADPNYRWAHALYARALVKTGRPKAALGQADRALLFEPGNASLIELGKEILRAIPRALTAEAA